MWRTEFEQKGKAERRVQSVSGRKGERGKVYRLGIGIMLVGLAMSSGWSTGAGFQRDPSWNLPVVGGGRLSLADLRGHVVIASFGATWCPPCRAELPALQTLADRYRGKRVKVVWISIDGEDVPDEKLAQFTAELGVSIPVLRDASGSVFAQFHQTSIPILVVIDQDGRLVGEPHVGFAGKEAFLKGMAEIIDRLLVR